VPVCWAKVRNSGYSLSVVHLRVLILDLYHRYLEDPAGWIGISLNTNSYSGPQRYNKLFLKYRPMKRLVKILADRGYIVLKRGFSDRLRGIGYQSRIRAESRLAELFTALHGEVGCSPLDERVPEQYARELVILHDELGNSVDYEETERTSRMRDGLRAYNEFLYSRYIDVSLRGWPEPVVIDLTRKGLYRVFNNRSWEQGGRFYGGWWENCPSELRQRIVISDKSTIEIDYSGLHVVLLYSMQGRDYWTAENEDPYLNDRIFRRALLPTQYKRLRATTKMLLNAAINASSRTKAIQGVQQEIDPLILGEAGIGLGELLDRLADFHAPIRERLYSGIGLHRQYVDSQITGHIRLLAGHPDSDCTTGRWPSAAINGIADVLLPDLTFGATKLHLMPMAAHPRSCNSVWIWCAISPTGYSLTGRASEPRTNS
jgi:hypothetical protein